MALCYKKCRFLISISVAGWQETLGFLPAGWRETKKSLTGRRHFPQHNSLNCSYRISSIIKQSFFSFQNNPKYLDPSYKTDLDLLDCLGRVKLVL